ncbi:MAG: TonB C-terminal domain-containing protein [Cohaesibacter sp.]|nr:TonB C-terminal domain-containing protein [Cohaesibacter sp.]
MSNYKGRVRARIVRKKRTIVARAKRSAIVVFTIHSSGSVSGIRITRSSGNKRVDREAQLTIRRAAPFPPLPKSISRSRLVMEVPVK